LSVPEVVQRFKSFTTTLYRRGVDEEGWQPFPGRLWQSNYYEHIIRDEEEWDCIAGYVRANPERWACDRENPLALQPWKPEAAWEV